MEPNDINDLESAIRWIHAHQATCDGERRTVQKLEERVTALERRILLMVGGITVVAQLAAIFLPRLFGE